MSFVEDMKAQAKLMQKKLVLPEGTEPEHFRQPDRLWMKKLFPKSSLLERKMPLELPHPLQGYPGRADHH